MEYLASQSELARAREAVESGKPVRYVSPSQIEKFLRCSEQWHFRYVEKIEEPQGVDQILGSSVHDALAYNYRQKILTGEDLPALEVAAEFDCMFGVDLARNDLAQKFDAFADVGSGLVRLYMAEVAPTIQPLLVEHRFAIPLIATRPDGTEILFVFNGFIDLITDTGIIRDHKIKGKPTAPKYVHEDIQMTSYASAYRLVYQEVEAAISYDQLIKSTPPRFLPVTTTRTETQCAKFMNIMRDVVVRMDAGEHTPNPDHFLCDPRWCAHWERCSRDATL